MDHHLIDEVDIERDYNQTRFLSFECQTIYYSDLDRKKLFLKRGISLDKVPKTLLVFYQRLVNNGWICFTS